MSIVLTPSPLTPLMLWCKCYCYTLHVTLVFLQEIISSYHNIMFPWYFSKHWCMTSSWPCLPILCLSKGRDNQCKVIYKGNLSWCRCIYTVKKMCVHVYVFVCILNHLLQQRYHTASAIFKTKGFNWIINGALKWWDLMAQSENKRVFQQLC